MLQIYVSEFTYGRAENAGAAIYTEGSSQRGALYLRALCRTTHVLAAFAPTALAPGALDGAASALVAALVEDERHHFCHTIKRLRLVC